MNFNTLEDAVRWLKFTSSTGTYMGLIRTKEDKGYMDSCRQIHWESGTNVIFTRDVGHHLNGWWKNPDFEQCFHLSLSFFDPKTEQPAPFDKKRGWEVAKLFFGDDCRWVWVEPPFTKEGKRLEVYHYRLFTDPGWQAIKPQGEVYNTMKTPVGWKSFSEIHSKQAENYDPPLGVA